MQNKKDKFLRFLKIGVLCVIFWVATANRIPMFSQVGKDIEAYTDASTDLLEGRNPYERTVQSFNNPDDPGSHGFAYLPTLMYINSIAIILSLLTKIPAVFLQKIPILLADIGVGILLCKLLYHKNYAVLLAALWIWFWNPYFYFKQNYVYMDPLPIFFMLAALVTLKKDSVISGTLFATAVSVKTFPIIALPVLLLKSKSPKHFLAAAIITGLAICAPFFYDIRTFMEGSVLIHGERFIQGRPFLFYISYFYDVELFQIIPFKVYTYLAMFSGPVLSLLLMGVATRLRAGKAAEMLQDEYILVTITFFCFYLFTPVLNKTYLLWFLPVFLLGMYSFANILQTSKNKALMTFLLISGSFWFFYYSYLIPWRDGFHIWRP